MLPIKIQNVIALVIRRPQAAKRVRVISKVNAPEPLPLRGDLKIINDKRGVLVAICDSGLLGETFRQGKMKLEVNTEFYGGALCRIEKAMESLAEADIANLVGEATIEAAIERGLVDPEAVIYFGPTPHVQIVRL